MAKTLNNFWGAETGGLEEVSVIIGGFSTVSSVTTHSGGYSYFIPDSIQGIKFSPFEAVPSAGGYYVWGFWWNPAGTDDSKRDAFQIYEGTTVILNISTTTNRSLTVDDANAALVATTANNVFTLNAWQFVEVYFSHSSASDLKIFINGTAVIDATLVDITSGGTFDGVGVKTSAVANIDHYVDDIYFMSGCTSAADRLGGCEVYSYRSNLNSATPDTGSALDTGTWANTQEVPFGETNIGNYANTGAGSVLTNDIGGNAPVNLTQKSGLTGSALCRNTVHNSDGTKWYVFDIAIPDTIRQFDLSTGWGVSTAATGSTFNTESATGDQDGASVTCKPDGSKFYTTCTNSKLYAFDLSTNWSISTAAYNSETKDLSGDMSGGIYGLAFNSDGSKIFVIGTTVIRRYSLSTNWDISTASFDTGQSFTHGLPVSGSGQIWGLVINSTGTIFYAGAYRINLSTGYDLTTASVLGNGQRVLVWGTNLSISSDGDHVLQVSSGNVRHADTVDTWVLSQQGGPLNDSRISGTIVGAKGIWRMSRTGGGGTAHYGLMGNSADGTTRSADFDPTTSYANYSFVSTAASVVPTASEYGKIGFEMDNAQDFQCADMLFQILHVPAAGPATPGIIYNPVLRYAPFLVR
jgi:hypothetical protein